jgi:amino acid adenylation domain-containing protein
MTDPAAANLGVAVVAMAGRFPGAAGVEQFWRNLAAGVESIRVFADSELESTPAPPGGRRDPAFVPAGAPLDDVELFDAAFFDFNPREAEITDPQQRIFLECCWEALERGGYDAERFDGAVGVFAGAGMSTYFFNNVLAHPELLRTVAPFQLQVGSDKDYLAPRVSYKLDLRGPSITVQTACSTSLVAVHLACQSLLDMQSDLALAGGVSVRVPQRTGYRYVEGGIASPDGHCRAFDRDAQGTVFGSGAGVVLLKRLDEALADGDTVLAVVRGSAVNNDGAAKVGFTAPSVSGQVAVISEALAAAGLDGAAIDYVEAHGTGTPLGDPIEVAALGQAFGGRPPGAASCALGSVKTNIGHLDSASGVAGLIKTVLALEHGAIPASLHFSSPNPQLDLAAGPFHVNAALAAWPANGRPRRAGVSSFGIGGTNAHVVLEEAPPAAPSGAARAWQLLALSARTPSALEAATDNLARHLVEHPEQELADVAYTLQVGRKSFPHRRLLLCGDRAAAAAALLARDPRSVRTQAVAARDRPVVFLFPGQGAQHVGMGRELYAQEPAFRAALDRCAGLLAPHLGGLDLRQLLYPPAGGDEAGPGESAASRLEQTAIAQPALFAVEYALAQLWGEWGVRPAAMLGHSVGEYVAACLAGVLTLPDALALVAERGRLMQALPPGAMAALPLPPAAAAALLAGSGLALAAANAPAHSVVSGPAAEVEALVERLRGEGLDCRRLHTSHAFHSAMMDPALEPFAAAVGRVRLSPPRIPYLSNLTGGWIEPAQATDPRYWVRHLRETVRFGDAAGELLGDRSRVLLEVGPGRTLGGLVRRHPLAAPETPVIAALAHPREEAESAGALGSALGRLWLAGVRIDWPGVHAHARRRRVLLPTYPFERQRFWLDPAPAAAAAAHPATAAAPATAAVPAPSEAPGAPPSEAAAAGTAAPRAAPADGAAAAAARHQRPALSTPCVAPASPMEQQVAELWSRALGIAGIGVHDDFFELGGHSLLATQLAAELRGRFAVDAPLKELFAEATVAGMVAVIHGHRQRDEAPPPAALDLPVLTADRANLHQPFPLTDVQQAYWIGRSGAFELGQVATHQYLEIDSSGVDLPRLEAALNLLVERHDMLRAVVLPDGRQQILERVPAYVLVVADLSGRGSAEALHELQAIRRRMSHQVLPSDRWPLFEVRASLLPAGRMRFHVSFDFLIGDAFSCQILLRELAVLYQDPRAELPPLAVSFRDYVLATLELERTAAFERALAYWRGRLADLPPAPELPLARSPHELERPRFVRRTTGLPRDAWQLLKRRASRAGLTPSGLLLAAYAEVLAAWSKSPRFTINLTLFNRLPLHPRIHELVGDFTSLTLCAVDGSLPAPFVDRARRLQEGLWEGLDHRLVSGVRVMRELARGQGGAGRALMPVVFTSTLNLTPPDEPPPAAEPPADPGAAGGAAPAEGYGISQTPQVWIDHQVMERAGRLHCTWDVVEDLFPAAMIDAMFAAFRGLLERLAESAGAGEEDGLALPAAWRQDRFDLVPAGQLAERAAVNDTPAMEAPPPGLLHTLVAPGGPRPAVIAPNRVLSYAELLGRSAALARALRELGASPNTLVAVVMEKGWEQVVAALGVLAAGAAYLPVDPELPAERRAWLLADGGVEIAVTQPWLEERFSRAGEWPAGLRRLAVRSEPEEPAPAAWPPWPPLQTAGDLAYVIYTSGSTGRPKGVAIDHRGAVNTVLDVNRRFGVGPEDRVFALSSLSFDLSVYDLFGTLAAGGAVVFPAAAERRDPAHWAERLQACGVTVWNSVPALMEMLVDYADGKVGRERRLPGAVRLVLLSGDWIPVELPGRIRELAPAAAVVSLGGATEASIWSILHPVAEVDPAWRSIPYGRPMRGQTFHVLDGGLEPRPTWVPGQLYIGGAGLARGYWGDPEKTAASFVTRPRTGERLYRTGDLGRYLPGGDIEFLGREDSQVKVRGYRVELGEIEAALCRHPAVREAVVAAHAGDRPGEKRLAAYLVAAGTAPAIGELRDFLRRSLPDYMVPASFLALPALPLTANGKVDRRALPHPASRQPEERRHHVAPRNQVETVLAAICGGALGVERLGVDDDLFELGADSLMAVRAIFSIRKAVGVELPVRSFFDTPTVAALAEHVAELLSRQQTALPAAEPAAPALPAPIPGRRAPEAEPRGAEPPSFAQQRLWRFARHAPRGSACNLFHGVRLSGRLDAGALAAALGRLVERHEALRTRFPETAEGPVALVDPPPAAPPALPLVDLTALAERPARLAGERALLALAERPFDLAHGPLLRPVLLRTAAAEHLLLLVVHHIAVDGWSLTVLVRDLAALYAAAAPPPPLLQAADFGRWQRQLLRAGGLEAELAWWRRKLAGAAPGGPRWPPAGGAAPASPGGRRGLTLDARATTALEALARRERVTLFVVVLAAWKALLHRHGGEDDVIVGTVVALRDRPETADLVGLLLNLLVLRTDLAGDPSFVELLERVRETTLAALAHQRAPFECLAAELAGAGTAAGAGSRSTPWIRGLFNMPLGEAAHAAPLRLPGLEVEPAFTGEMATEFDWTLYARQTAGAIRLDLGWSPGVFAPGEADALLAELAALLEEAASDPGRRLARLPLATGG